MRQLSVPIARNSGHFPIFSPQGESAGLRTASENNFCHKSRFYHNILIILFLTPLLAGCSWFGFGKKTDRPPDVMAQEAGQKMKSGKYGAAAEDFEKIRDRYTYSPEATQAELKVADSKYYNKKYDEALNDYKNFEKLHPAHPDVPYVIYQQGLCYYRQRGTIDRDPTYTYKALQEFKRLKQRYPDYAKMEKVNDYILKCQKALADHEFYIGEYYFNQKRYQAALDRFAAIQEEYPDYPKMPKVKEYVNTCETYLANPVEANPPALLKPWYYLFDAKW
jgi:outer membrane protein assembly factor BamD